MSRLFKKKQLQALLDCIQQANTPAATLIRPMDSMEDLDNPNVVKVVVDLNFKALYFSRAPIPMLRAAGRVKEAEGPDYYTHIGLYAFRRDALESLVKLEPTQLELAESLEQLRWMEHGFQIQTAVSSLRSLGVDTPEDLEKIKKEYKI